MDILNDCRPEAGRTRGILSTTLSVCFSFFIAFMLMGVPQAMAHPGPHWDSQVFVSGNAECVGGEEFFKVDTGGLGAGNYDFEDLDGGLKVHLTIYSDKSFDWSVTGGTVAQVGVKGGRNTFRYSYNPAATHDHGLYAPNTNSGSRAGLSHISFCYFPGAPELTTVKTCPQPVFNSAGDGLIYTMSHTIKNTSTDGSTLYDIQIKESMNNCSITKINGGAAAVNLHPAGTWGNVVGSLALNAMATLEVTCNSPSPVGSNTIHTRASTIDNGTADVFDDASDNCPQPAPPRLGIEKACGEPMIKLLATTDASGADILAVQACVDITVSNLSDQLLTNVEIEDAEIFGSGVAVQFGDGTLGPNDQATETHCYLPDMPTGNVLEETNGETTYSIFTLLSGGDLWLEALFSNEASAFAFAPVTSTNLGPVSDSTHCSICYSDQTNPGLPSACPHPSNVPYLLD